MTIPTERGRRAEMNGLPMHIDINEMTRPIVILEQVLEAMVRAGLMTVDGSIGNRINARIAAASSSPSTGSKMIGQLPGPGEWKVSKVGDTIVLASPHVGIFAVQGDELRQLPPDWDGASLGRPVPPLDQRVNVLREAIAKTVVGQFDGERR